MSIDRRNLKQAIIGMLDDIAEEHPLGHQTSKAQRYVLISRHGARIEIMFEKDEARPANIWCLDGAAGRALKSALKFKLKAASDLWDKPGKYGRHSALQKMPQLGEADLVCFAPENLRDVAKIIDRLLSVMPAEIV